ncbi:sigma factor-like helix-turn-helix DNA-binding protein [Nocardia amikacinitolerans]|uniref:sigma factor-like helix-turn-helix DNA-binding protein n=1 Tax=Nocardia amikacinitolerans TaxID=756689 RepID=UPI0020A3C6FD|nr:sigma factor-like helix-turn-helix DNA-binding protein [Nocardia amikacinitolerans]MCP2288470.1 Sigma-70, region 4 [Nocardia amikacinitolerans]
MALIVVLESLTPLERSVFVLHEVFGYPHTEIAEILGRGPATVRRIPHRARGATLGHGVPAGPLIPRCARR